MPEYLAPGVYLEEVPSSNKPIEGASTSTAGVVGVTQRGPVNEPTLITSIGQFNRVFGGLLDHRAFTEGRDALPYAMQGFFNNGGQRVYVSRIVGTNAGFATTDLYGIPLTNPAATALSARAAEDDVVILVDDATNIAAGDQLLLEDDVRSEYVAVQGAPVALGIRINAALRGGHADNAAVTAQTVTAGADLTADIGGDMAAGGGLLLSAAAIATLNAGDVLRLRGTVDTGVEEYVTITTAATADFDEGTLLFDHPAAATEVHVVTLAAGTATTLTAAVLAGDFLLPLAATAGLADGDVVLIGSELQVIRSIVSSVSIATTPLSFNHAANVAVVRQVPLVRVHARYQGVWGNSLRIRSRAASLLETTVDGGVAAGESIVTLDAVFGLYPGSVLSFSRAGAPVAIARVLNVNLATNEVELSAGLGAALVDEDDVQSLEYDLIVERMELGKVAESEAFEKLAIDPEHARYAPRVVGAFDRQAARASASGESELVRLSDLTRDDAGVDDAALIGNRTSVPYTVTRPMAGGSDDLANIDDNTYIGVASDDPGNRTGIHSLQNEESLSIVAVPGRPAVAVQKALLAHCERMRYRFAVLDTPVGSGIGEALTHRRNFDTTRGAVYYPWLCIPDLFGEKGDLLKVPPSGHVMGIYARTDTQRGVWKAPANEVVRAILQFETALTKGEQDILNPNHVNAFRDFRTANRGLRLWGARTLSSDPEWKYVNVRRLFLFLEQSIETGLQFAVFEPNSEPLWATVKQSISSFLTTIWRAGGLEGTSEEEAYFVNVGFNVTMTQADIDNGRLIVEVGVAPVKPAEFVIIRISQKTREATS